MWQFYSFLEAIKVFNYTIVLRCHVTKYFVTVLKQIFQVSAVYFIFILTTFYFYYLHLYKYMYFQLLSFTKQAHYFQPAVT